MAHNSCISYFGRGADGIYQTAFKTRLRSQQSLAISISESKILLCLVFRISLLLKADTRKKGKLLAIQKGKNKWIPKKNKKKETWKIQSSFSIRSVFSSRKWESAAGLVFELTVRRDLKFNPLDFFLKLWRSCFFRIYQTRKILQTWKILDLRFRRITNWAPSSELHGIIEITIKLQQKKEKIRVWKFEKKC